ncbi:hypothetical protein C2857_007771 [Epichloe festucae Fl1]|uniref:Uncharacterized protein n=2 Tax=Epichloe festucae TaxID=35717 RepID=A0A7S9KR32_EPIFF|nr:hypothetical protein C2857_007771 [Epichloe festucae Fl1]
MKTILALSVAAVAQAAFSTETIHKGSAPVLSSIHADVVPDSYIIKFKDHVDEAKANEHHAWVKDIHTGGEEDRFELRKRGLGSSIVDAFSGTKHTFNFDGFKGYSGHFHESVIEKVRNNPDVEFIEKDTVVHTMLPLTSEHSVQEDKCDPGETEKQAPWGLARLSHRDSLRFSTYNKYLYATEGGEGVDAYVIDTGTNVDHVDFEGRAKWGKTIPSGDADEDGNGHGTHCSGTIAGKKYGVAKKAHVYAVKVLRSNGSGSMSDVVKGVEFAANSHTEQVKAAKDGKRKGFKGSVANMSLGGGKTSALDAAVNAAVKVGIHFAVAAGNDNADACDYSPAAAEHPVTVGASAFDDSRAYFSNYGKCTDIFAPGLNILSTWIGSKYAVNTISGTSMASPHICGLLAYYLSLQPAKDSEYSVAAMTPKDLKDALIEVSTEGVLSDIPSDTPNKLAWNGGGCNNYSKIVAAGGYKAKSEASELKKIEKVAMDEAKEISGKVVKGVKHLGEKTEKFVEKVHSVVDKEIEHFISEISSRVFSVEHDGFKTDTNQTASHHQLTTMLRRNSTRSIHKRPLGRSRSTNSIAQRSINSQVTIDSALAERDAHIAANLSYHRAHCCHRHIMRTACQCQTSEANMIRRSASVDGRLERQPDESNKKKQSVRFTGPTAKPRRQLASRAKPVVRDSSTVIASGPSRQEDFAFAARTELIDTHTASTTPCTGTNPRRPLRKSKSMYNQSIHTIPSCGGSYTESTPVQHCRNAPLNPRSSSREDEQLQYSIRRSLRAPKSMSYLDYRMNQTATEDVEMKRDGLLSPVKEYSSKGSFHRLKSHSSMFFRSKHRRQESCSLDTSRSFRNSSDHSAAISSVFSGNMAPSEKSSGIRFTARRVSRNVKHKLSRLFGRSRSTDGSGNEMGANALHDIDGESCRPLASPPPVEEASMSRVTSHVPSLHAVPSYQQMRSRQGSLESICYDERMDLDQRSRITSWTNSTANTIASCETNEEREYQRLSVIKENGMHVPSNSQTGSREEPPHAAAAAHAAKPNMVIDSQRVYSALMKKLKSDVMAEGGGRKRSESPKQVSLKTVPPRQSSLDRAEVWSPRTIRGIGTDEDDVFEDSKGFASLRIPSSSTYSRNEALGEDSSKSTSYKAYPDPTAGDGKGLSPNSKSPTAESASSQSSAQAGRSSTFSPSPSNFLFRTTSPYRRALQRSIQEQQETRHTRALDTRYLSTLSALTLPTRCPSTLGSERDVRLTYAESFYSFITEDLTSSNLNPPEVAPNPIVEEETEEVQPDMARPMATPSQCRDMSSASSVEWKTWLSAHVSKLEAPHNTTSARGAETATGSSPSVRHVRENAEIESPADMPKANVGHKQPSVPLMEGSGNILKPHSENIHTRPDKVNGTPAVSPSDVELGGGRPLDDEETHDQSPLVPPPIPCRNILRTVTSLPNVENETATDSVKCKQSITHRRSLNNIPTWVPLPQDGAHRKRRDQENERRDAPSSKGSNLGLATVTQQSGLDSKTGSPLRYKTRTLNSPHTPVGPVAGPGNVPESVKSEWDAQIRGSRRMVDLFLSSRRKAIQGPMSRNGSDNFSAAAFL